MYLSITKDQNKNTQDFLGIQSIEELFKDIGQGKNIELALPNKLNELELKKEIQNLSSKNNSLTNYSSFLGAGSYEHYSPSVINHVISRSEFYTAYTPYQAEISQGTLKAIFEFQTMVCELMGLEIANASLYDGATALAEACIMAFALTKRNKILVPAQLSPMYLQVLDTYLIPKSVEVDVFHSENLYSLDLVKYKNQLSDNYAAVLLPCPDFMGNIYNYQDIIKQAKDLGVTIIYSCDPIALAIFKSPGEQSADIAVAEGQSLGLPTSFGGPYLGLMAAKSKYTRLMPGRIVGKSTDKNGKTGYLLTFQTREQHIRREKALSNICSNQGLMALAATVYMSYFGPKGLRAIAEACYQKAAYLKNEISKIPGFRILNPDLTFKEFLVALPCSADKALKKLKTKNILGGVPLSKFYSNSDNLLLMAVTEMRSQSEIDLMINTLREIK